MPSAKKTPNYNLTQYADNGTDKVSFMGDYNGDMSKIDTALNDNANNIITKADAATTYSKTDVDTKLATKADTATTYSKTDVDTKLSAKSDTATTYSKTDVDSKLSAKADTATTYSKTDVDTKLSAKADTATTYSKTEVDTNIAKVRQSAARRRYTHMVCIGDSWGEGYYAGAKHRGFGWPEKLNALFNAPEFDNMCVSASGFLVPGDSKTFPEQWNAVPNKSDVDLVVIMGGQNDASNQNADLTQLPNTLIGMMSQIKHDAPNAEVHVFPMVLARGQQLTFKQSFEGRLPTSRRVKALSYFKNSPLLFHDFNTFGDIYIHDGVYRWGMAVDAANDAGDGAHVTEGGYAQIAGIMATCIAQKTDYWPNFQNDFANSDISGTWLDTSIIEANGMLYIHGFCQWNAAIHNGQLITTLPWYARPTVSRFFSSAPESGKYFISMDDGLRIQAFSGGTTGSLIVDITSPAGY